MTTERRGPHLRVVVVYSIRYVLQRIYRFPTRHDGRDGRYCSCSTTATGTNGNTRRTPFSATAKGILKDVSVAALSAEGNVGSRTSAGPSSAWNSGPGAMTFPPPLSFPLPVPLSEPYTSLAPTEAAFTRTPRRLSSEVLVVPGQRQSELLLCIER